jgi:uncharacterized protein YfaT (DUF1175 family)
MKYRGMIKSSGLHGLIFLSIAAALLAAALPPHLDSAIDREAFRRWFTFLAESRFYAASPNTEITDCAGLVRWSIRTALAPHDSAWAGSADLATLPALPFITHAPFGPNLFRIGETQFAQFADADTLRRYNTFFVSRDIFIARPGDLLFYRQFDRRMPAHVMIYLGSSQIAPSPQKWIIYHTGPSGEIRKVSTEDLLAHPSPEWRPVPGNSNFLGFRRLNLLRE